MKTNANALAVNNAGIGGVFVSELNNVTLRTISLNVGGNLNTVSNSNSGSFSLISGGDVNVAGLVSSAGSMILDAGGNLKLDGSLVDAVLMSNGGQTITAESIDLTAQNGRRANIENTNGNQSVSATAGDIDLLCPRRLRRGPDHRRRCRRHQTVHAERPAQRPRRCHHADHLEEFRHLQERSGRPADRQRRAGISLQGASTGTSAGALISSQSDQSVDVTGGNINIFGGNGSNINNAAILASASGQQTIRAHNINTSDFAVIVAASAAPSPAT